MYDPWQEIPAKLNLGVGAADDVAFAFASAFAAMAEEMLKQVLATLVVPSAGLEDTKRGAADAQEI